jgi:hypothetical protein
MVGLSSAWCREGSQAGRKGPHLMLGTPYPGFTATRADGRSTGGRRSTVEGIRLTVGAVVGGVVEAFLPALVVAGVLVIRYRAGA